MRSSTATIAVAVLGLVLPCVALAHAFLEHASPAVGSTVRLPPAELRLWFSEALEPAFSSARVLDASGHDIGARSQITPDHPREIAVPLGALAPGKYQVRWRVVSVDTHRTEGDFTFTVAP
jgi:methionine-rich copper-binding protein CopC